jgi:flagellin
MTGFATPDGSGGLNVNLSNARPDDFTARTLQIANGTTLQTPAGVTGIGNFHDPLGPPPTVILSGADAGLSATATVQPNGKVNVSFAGTPTTAGTLNVQVLGAGGTGSTSVSSKYLLDLDGDLWDYSVSEFESFTKLVSDARGQNGAEQNSLSTFWELLSTNVNKLEQAAGRIKDADFAKEMTEVSKSQINTRSAAVMLGKQNRITSEALLTLQNLSNML